MNSVMMPNNLSNNSSLNNSNNNNNGGGGGSSNNSVSSVASPSNSLVPFSGQGVPAPDAGNSSCASPGGAGLTGKRANRTRFTDYQIKVLQVR